MVISSSISAACGKNMVYPLQVQQQRRQEGSALGKRFDLDVLVVGVCPSALDAQAVERGNPDRCREVAVATASGRALGELDSQPAADQARPVEERRDGRGPLHGRATELTFNL